MNLFEYHKFLFLDDDDPYTEEELQTTIYYFNTCAWRETVQLSIHDVYNIKSMLIT